MSGKPGRSRPDPSSPTAPPPGLCSVCRHARLVTSGRGSRFVLCELSRADERFPRYPRLPVLSCAGFEALDADEALDAAEALDADKPLPPESR